MFRTSAVVAALLASVAVAHAQTAPPPCAVWSNAENRCLDAPTPPTPRRIDARLGTVKKAWVQPVDDLALDRPVSICFVERLSRLTPIESVKTKPEADVIFRIKAHVASDADRSFDALRNQLLAARLPLPAEMPKKEDLPSTASITAELPDGSVLWSEKYYHGTTHGDGIECILAEDLLTTLRDAMKKARDQK